MGTLTWIYLNASTDQNASTNQDGPASSNPIFKMNLVDDDYYKPFQKQEIRHHFLKCMYIIITVQLAMTAAIVCVFEFHKPSNEWLKIYYIHIAIVAAVVFVVVTVLILACEAARKSLLLTIMFFIFTVSLGSMLSVTAVEYSNDAVLWSLGGISAFCICLTIFACQINYELTALRSFIICGVIIILSVGIISSFFYYKIFRISYATIGMVVASLCLIVNTNLILRGKTKYPIGPDEHILGATSLYVNTIWFFKLTYCR